MTIILGIESTAHTFGVGIVKNGKVIANKNKTYTTEQGGIIPIESARHHCENKHEIYAEAINCLGHPKVLRNNKKLQDFEALDEAGIDEKDIDAIAFSQGPGLAPCLLEGMKFAKELAGKLKKPIIPVNHCIAHLEVGRLTKIRDPVMLYVSGANTQIIAYTRNEDISGCSKVSKRAYACKSKQKLSCESGKYRIFGETLDIGVGNFIDNFARYAGIGFPGGPAIEKLALQGKKYIELPYTVKGMDIALSGILTNLRQKIERINISSNNSSFQFIKSSPHPPTQNISNIKNKLPAHLHSQIDKNNLIKNSYNHSIELVSNNSKNKCNKDILLTYKKSRAERGNLFIDYTLQDLCYSMQETVFAMLVETAERALAHTGKKELLLGGGVACNSRLQEMCRIMCKERGAKLFVPERSLLADNGGMIAYLGEIMFKKKIFEKNLNKIDIKPRQRTDDVEVLWMD